MGYNKNNSKGMPKHGHHMVNSWEEEDVKRGKKQMAEGHKGHAEALFDDAHGSYNWRGGYHGSEGFHMHGSFMSKHAGNSYFHKQNLLDDMPVDDHAGGPLNQTEQKQVFKDVKDSNSANQQKQAMFVESSPEEIARLQEEAKKNKMLKAAMEGGKPPTIPTMPTSEMGVLLGGVHATKKLNKKK